MSDSGAWQPPSSPSEPPPADPFGGSAPPQPAAAPPVPPVTPPPPVQQPFSTQPYGPPPGTQPYGAQPYGPPPGAPYGAPPPPYAAPATSFGAAGFGAPGFGAPPQAGLPYGQQEWTPPPKPGLVPLQPMGLGTILSGSFTVLRRNPRPTFGVALLFSLALFILSGVIVGVVGLLAFSRLDTAPIEEQEEIAAGATAITLLSALVPMALALIASAVFQGIISLEVARATIGEKLTFGGLWRLSKGRIGALIGWTMLVTLAVTIALAVAVGILALIAITAGDAGPAVAIVLGILLFLGAIVIGAWLGTKLSMVPSAIVLERLDVFAAVRRSWTLTDRFFWRTFGIQLLVGFILNLAAQVVTTPVSFLGGILVSFFGVSGDPTTMFVLLGVVYLLTFLVTIVVSAITIIVQSATTTLLYLDLRIRKEGLDLELIRFVEARAAGDDTVENPYLSSVSPTGPGAAAAA